MRKNRSRIVNRGANLRYPVSGGLLTAVTATQKKPDKYRKFYVSGVKDCLDVCEAMKTGEVAGCFIEMNACHGGCVNGPSTATSVSSFKVKLDLEAMLPKEPADLSLMHEAARQVEIHRTFCGPFSEGADSDRGRDPGDLEKDGQDDTRAGIKLWCVRLSDLPGESDRRFPEKGGGRYVYSVPA